jgi:oligopeptidase B
VSYTYHGHQRWDEFAWLRAENWREAMLDPSVLPEAIAAYLHAENDYSRAVMAETSDLQDRLYAELRGRIKEDDSSVPSRDGPWFYYSRFREGGQQPLLCRRYGEDGAETILLDGDSEAAGRDYFRLGGAEHSPDHRLLAYAVDTTGAEAFEVRFRDLVTGEDLADHIGNARGDFEWAEDSRTLFYTTLDADHRPKWVYRHTLGESVQEDSLVYEEPDPGFFVGVGKTESRRYLLIDAHDHTTSEVRYLPADQPTAEPVLFAEREREVEYEVSDHGERWLILTNRGGAEDFRICEAPLSDTAPSAWVDLIPHRPGCLIQGLLVFRDWLVRQELVDAQPRIVIRRAADGAEHSIDFDEACYSLDAAGGFEYATDTLRLGYSSFATPARVYDYDMGTGERILRKEQAIPSGHDPEAYVSRRLMATAPDGEQVPVSLFHRWDTVPDDQTPLLLYGYGAYGMSELPGFSPNRLSLVDRGFVLAIAHVRGGMERGYRWYQEGKLQSKPNTFSDCIAAAEALIEAGYSSRGNLSLLGGSAGGMLVGAVINKRPDLFRAAVADVPFVDVLNTMLDPTLPLTPPEWPEWGNPIESADDYFTILSYSPYDNVAHQRYPHLLVTAGVSDPRVTYWEPAKWVARLRNQAAEGSELLLWTNMSAGHGGSSGRFKILEEVAFRYAFLLRAFGLTAS